MRRPPTDVELLKAIYERHRSDFDRGREDRASDVWVPVDVPALAQELGVNTHSVFGRLHYHLERKYGEASASGGRPRKAFFLQNGVVGLRPAPLRVGRAGQSVGQCGTLRSGFLPPASGYEGLPPPESQSRC